MGVGGGGTAGGVCPPTSFNDQTSIGGTTAPAVNQPTVKDAATASPQVAGATNTSTPSSAGVPTVVITHTL
ncbi:hypothetical protein KP509_12G093300 [Ceratopteris richardii]|uniref:Uncharacterized protein n=1 Tax=Ceratopteris richardii TaxID=49495 RepID=A0A8T2TQV2_CERRI|nr:hypothetical protein KP509_12G093300 [Ceratopteris richardii]